MDRLLALIALLASLFGCDGGRDTVVHRITDAGVDRLFSRATIDGGATRFDCVRSATGTCHYVVLPPACTDPARCDDAAQRFAVAAGASFRIQGLRASRLCVAVDARVPPEQCTTSDMLGR